MTGPLRAGPTARSSDVRPFPAVPFPDRYYGLSMSLYRRRVYASALLEVTGFAMPCLLTLTGPPHTRFVFLAVEVSPRASSRFHLTMTPLPPARG